jgi:hypothetical protein
VTGVQTCALPIFDLDKGQKLREGDRLRLVGEPGDDKQRDVYGQARVLELKARGTVAELLMEADDSLPEALFAFVDETVTERPRATGTRPAKVEEPIALADPFAKDPKGQPLPDGRPPEPKVDPKTTEPVKVEPVKVEPAKVEQAQPAALPRIEGTVFFTRRRDVLFGNTSTSVRVSVKSGAPTGTSCDVHLPNGTHMIFPVLRSNDSRETDASAWTRDPRPDPNKAQEWVLVECRDAAGYFAYRESVKK